MLHRIYYIRHTYWHHDVCSCFLTYSFAVITLHCCAIIVTLSPMQGTNVGYHHELNDCRWFCVTDTRHGHHVLFTCKMLALWLKIQNTTHFNKNYNSSNIDNYNKYNVKNILIITRRSINNIIRKKILWFHTLTTHAMPYRIIYYSSCLS